MQTDYLTLTPDGSISSPQIYLTFWDCSARQCLLSILRRMGSRKHILSTAGAIPTKSEGNSKAHLLTARLQMHKWLLGAAVMHSGPFHFTQLIEPCWLTLLHTWRCTFLYTKLGLMFSGWQTLFAFSGWLFYLKMYCHRTYLTVI